MPRSLLLLPLLLLAACGQPDAAPAVEPSVSPAAAREAARMACATEHLLERARDDLDALTEMIPDPGEGADARTRGAGALLVFSRAYHRYAEVAAGRYEQMGLALNAPTREDSARHMERAAQFTLLAPDDDSLEGNVARSYERNLDALLEDAQHPCNRE